MGVNNVYIADLLFVFCSATCNRAARVCSMSSAGQLLMFEHEFKEQEAQFAGAEPLPISAKVILEAVTLKVSTLLNFSSLSTDDGTVFRAYKENRTLFVSTLTSCLKAVRSAYNVRSVSVLQH